MNQLDQLVQWANYSSLDKLAALSIQPSGLSALAKMAKLSPLDMLVKHAASTLSTVLKGFDGLFDNQKTMRSILEMMNGTRIKPNKLFRGHAKIDPTTVKNMLFDMDPEEAVYILNKAKHNNGGGYTLDAFEKAHKAHFKQLQARAAQSSDAKQIAAGQKNWKAKQLALQAKTPTHKVVDFDPVIYRKGKNYQPYQAAEYMPTSKTVELQGRQVKAFLSPDGSSYYIKAPDGQRFDYNALRAQSMQDEIAGSNIIQGNFGQGSTPAAEDRSLIEQFNDTFSANKKMLGDDVAGEGFKGFMQRNKWAPYAAGGVGMMALNNMGGGRGY